MVRAVLDGSSGMAGRKGDPAWLGGALPSRRPVAERWRVIGQVVAYGVARPAREVLFTVVSRREKYRAKARPRPRAPALSPQSIPHAKACRRFLRCC